MRRNFITLLCLLTLVFGVSVNSHAVITTNLYFPHVASNANWETEIGIINTGVTLLSGVLRAYDSNGDEVENQQLVLSSNARVELSVGNDFDHPDQIRYIIFEHATDTSCRGYEKFYTAGQRVAIPAVEDVNGSTIYISHIASDTNWWTGFALVNTTDEAKTIIFTLNDGSRYNLTLQAGQHWSGTLAGSFPAVDAASIKSATISNASGIIGLELFGSTEASGNHYLSGILLTDQTTNTLYYPHVASDANWWTGIVSYNPSTIASTITITPYTASGQALSTTNLEVAAKSKYIGAVAGLNLPQDTAWFKVDSSSPITGFELFGQKDGSQLAGYSAVNIQTKQGTFLKTDHQGWTGIAFVNTEDQPATVTLAALNDRGTTIASSSIQLVGNGKQVSLAETFFAPTDISNASYIKFSSDKELVGFQLNSSADSMMLDGLPGLAATVCTDSDSDGYYAEGGACGAVDSDDTNANIYPGAPPLHPPFTEPNTGIEFVWVEAGCFQMGSDEGSADEQPVHEICVDGYYIAKYETTQNQWQAITGNNPSASVGDDLPVEQVSWNDIQVYLTQLNNLTSGGYRLPTEAQWEYAAKGGEDYAYAGSDNIDAVGWYRDNSGDTTHVVGQKQPNGYGLYDMSGNVFELCHDWYGADYYASSPTNNPQGPDAGTQRIRRGGSWWDTAIFARLSVRLRKEVDRVSGDLGFRLVFSPAPDNLED